MTTEEIIKQLEQLKDDLLHKSIMMAQPLRRRRLRVEYERVFKALCDFEQRIYEMDEWARGER